MTACEHEPSCLHPCVECLEDEGDRYREALEAIVRHADMPDGESWEQAYVEVTTMARAALPGGRS